MEKLNPAADLSLDNLDFEYYESAFLGHFCPHLPQWMHSAASITGKAAGPVLSMRSAPVGQQPDLAQRWQWTHVLRSGLTLQRLHRDVIASMAPNGQI